MHGRRTQAWWLVRLELAAGIGLTLLVGQEAWDWAMLITFGGGYPRWGLGPLALPSNVVVAMVALAIAVAGLVRMVRIFRGPRDEPPLWRYRDR
jgi:hypothetical protein